MDVINDMFKAMVRAKDGSYKVNKPISSCPNRQWIACN